MHATLDEKGRIVIERRTMDHDGEWKTVEHVMDLEGARQLRDELTEAMKKCVVLEAIRFNRSNEVRLVK